MQQSYGPAKPYVLAPPPHPLPRPLLRSSYPRSLSKKLSHNITEADIPFLLPRSSVPPCPVQVGKEGFWYQYIKELDRQRARGVQAVESPLLWSDEELVELLQVGGACCVLCCMLSNTAMCTVLYHAVCCAYAGLCDKELVELLQVQSVEAWDAYCAGLAVLCRVL